MDFLEKLFKREEPKRARDTASKKTIDDRIKAVREAMDNTDPEYAYAIYDLDEEEAERKKRLAKWEKIAKPNINSASCQEYLAFTSRIILQAVPNFHTLTGIDLKALEKSRNIDNTLEDMHKPGRKYEFKSNLHQIAYILTVSPNDKREFDRNINTLKATLGI